MATSTKTISLFGWKLHEIILLSRFFSFIWRIELPVSFHWLSKLYTASDSGVSVFHQNLSFSVLMSFKQSVNAVLSSFCACSSSRMNFDVVSWYSSFFTHHGQSLQARSFLTICFTTVSIFSLKSDEVWCPYWKHNLWLSSLGWERRRFKTTWRFSFHHFDKKSSEQWNHDRKRCGSF